MPRLINGYHTTNKTERFFGKATDYHIGLELEVEAPDGHDSYDKEADAAMVRGCFRARKYLFFESDGSLRNGFEMITAPMTPWYFRDRHNDWRNALAYLASNGYNSHNTTTCGLHVHVGWDAFGELDSEREFNATKAVLIVEKFWDDIVKVARRDSRWARRLNTVDAKRIEEDVKYAKRCGSDHGKAVNLGNEHTVEFRMFKGTLKADTLFATIEFVVALVSAANNLSLKAINDAPSLRACLTRGRRAGKLAPALDAYLSGLGL